MPTHVRLKHVDTARDAWLFHQGMDSKANSESIRVGNSLVQRIRRVQGDVQHVMKLTREAESAGLGAQMLNQVLDEAMNNFGPVGVKLCFDDYSELCTKRFQALCLFDPKEASVFHKFMKKKNINQSDSRCHLALAELELRSNQPEKAIEVLENGLNAGARPADPLQAMLSQLRKDHCPVEAAKTTVTGDRASNSPLVRRALRYTGCDEVFAPIVEEPASDELVSERIKDLPATANEWVHRSSLDNLSPIIEADSVDQSNLNESGLALAVGAAGKSRRHSAPIVAEKNPAESRRHSSSPLAQIPAEMVGANDGAACGSSQQPDRELKTSGNSSEQRSPGEGAAAGTTEVSDADMSDLSSDAPPNPQQAAKSITVNGVTYVRRRTIGRGGSSKVFLVQGPTGESFALKRVSTNCASHIEALANEVTILQQLKDVPNVIQVYDAQVNLEQGEILIVMERGEMDLGRFLQSEQNLALGDIQTLWRQMLEAVNVIHTERIVHSDLKPGNFLLVDGRLKLIDFGIAKSMPAESTHISREVSVGTISYMAPEAVRQGALKLGRSSDIWSLGIILYQMVYRQVPLAHLQPMQRIFKLTDPNMAMNFPPGHRFEGHDEDTKAVLIDVLERCLQRDPRRRPSISELLQHPFLRDSMEVTRCAFDRTFQAVVAGFCEAARSTFVRAAPDACDDEDDADSDIESPCHDQWQLLADEMWSLMSKRSNGNVCVEASQATDGSPANVASSAASLGTASFQKVLRHWIARGSGKRQKTVVSNEVVESPRQPLVAFREPSTSRSQIASAPMPPPLPRPPLPAKQQSHGVVSDAAERSAAPAIHAGLLQQQRMCLKKVTPRQDDGKENSMPKRHSNVRTGMSESVSLALRRLKDRRHAVADEGTEEFTQTTKWDACVSSSTVTPRGV